MTKFANAFGATFAMTMPGLSEVKIWKTILELIF